jgi:hypothetical protein
LLLDEHFSPEIARHLRERGHDVIAVKERADLLARPDRAHFASMRDQRRAIVTQDLGDFRPLLEQATNAGETTYGLICVPPRSGFVARRQDSWSQRSIDSCKKTQTTTRRSSVVMRSG